ncbi:MAG: RnfABCDGE type electron transport complex subunit D, partial [Phycisphaerae bacterium]|nr:RnfABCDGE type electron transport complex subunit D [Phycisphaerae bacterium]
LILPPTLPLWMVAVGVMFGVFIGKELFGGTGRNVFNPAIVGRVFLAMAYPTAMTTWAPVGKGILGNMTSYVTPQSIAAAAVDGVTTATPLGGADVSVVDMFLGNVSGSLGESSALMIIIGGVFLLMTRVSNWRTVVGVLGSAAVFSFVLNKSNPDEYMPAVRSLFAGGLMFGAFFMATDPVSSPVTNAGKWGYGILIGALVILIRNFSAFPEGMMFAILLGNIAAPILDEIVFNVRFRRLKNEG